MLLASGAAIPISRLRVGDKVLATHTQSGKTQPETVTAVLLHHDTNLYNLSIRDHGKTAVIHTTSNHLFWAPATAGHGGKWIKAGSLKYGTHLRAPAGRDIAVVIGGYAPRVHDGWMWDLTVPGNNDHDFYIDTATAGILVQNVDDPEECAAAARYARDLTGQELGNEHATYAGGYNSETGQVYVGCSSNPAGCAEDDLAQQGADTFTKAFVWRGGQWTEIETCLRCQENYNLGQFPDDVGRQPGGAWSDMEGLVEDVADLGG